MKISGKKIAITSTIENFEKAVATAKSAGLDAAHFATIEIQPLDFTVSGRQYDWVIFTSRNAVDFFVKKSGKGYFKGKKTGSIGGETSAALEKCGIKSDFIPSEFNSQAFVKEAGIAYDFSGKKVLLPCSAISGKNIADGLTALGAEIDRLFVYTAVKAQKSSSQIKEFMDNRPYRAILFSSPSSFKNYLEITGEEGRAALMESAAIAIGAQTADTIIKSGFNNVITSDKSSFESMVRTASKL